jgi:hypothetical protein
MTESPSLRLLVPTVGGVSLHAARLLSADDTAVALPTVTEAANPEERAASSCATKSHSENDFGHRVSIRMTHDVTLHEIEDQMRSCGEDDDISFPTFFRRKFRKQQIQMIDDSMCRASSEAENRQ